jgi:succinate dehydrogenase / fumarate reductase iron-sulfur subunit
LPWNLQPESREDLLETYHVKIKRNDFNHSYWDYFEVSSLPENTIKDLLESIQRNPIDQKKKPVSPVVFESCCQQGLCGTCLVLVDGLPQLLCQTKLDTLPKSFTLEPLSTYPVLRDLIVDKSFLFEQEILLAKRPSVGDFNFHALATRVDSKPHFESSQWEQACIECGACIEVCPRTQTGFGGARLALKGLHLINENPQDEASLMQSLINDLDLGACDNAMACVKACPKDIPLDRVWGTLKRKISQQWFKAFAG